MEKIKGCGNESCEAHQKKLICKESEAFCSKCGRPLVYVCKDCYTQLPPDTDKYCVRCLAKHEDRKDKAKKVAAWVSGTVGTGAMAIFGKKVFRIIGKLALDVVKMRKG